MDPKEILKNLYVLALTDFAPQQHVIHKPNGGGTGAAMKIQLRLAPKWIETDDGGYFDREANKEGGLFLELAGQGAKDGKGNPTFKWQDAENVIRCKLGIADISGLLAAIRNVRSVGLDVPTYLQSKQNPQPNQVSLFHKFNTGTTIISYTLDDQQSVVRISKGKDKARSIALTLGEEIIFQHMLELALKAYLKVGKR